MPKSMPDPTLLLQAAIKYLEQELMPTLDGYHRFKTRVTANALSIIHRELKLQEEQAAAERARLSSILGHDGEVEAMSRELAERIRAGEFKLDDPALRAHIRQSLADALTINNPKWLTR
jgi:hypothetical protein